MPRVTFIKDFDWRPHRNVVYAFKSGVTAPVSMPCARAALAKGAIDEQSASRPITPDGANSVKIAPVSAHTTISANDA